MFGTKKATLFCARDEKAGTHQERKDPAAARGLFNQSGSSHCAASPPGDDGGWTEGQLP